MQAVTVEVFAEVKRAIVVCAHADDLETMMGGTAWMLAQRGVEIYELILTRGDLGATAEDVTRDQLAAIRRDEARRAGDILGLREVVTLDYPDGELVPSLEVRADIVRYYRAWQADTIFTFDPYWPGQIHPDHRAAGRAAVDAFMPSKMRLYHPEQLGDAGVGRAERLFFFSPANPTAYVDVTDVYDKKVAASLVHTSQFPEGEKNLEWMRQLDEETAKRAGMEGRLVEQYMSGLDACQLFRNRQSYETAKTPRAPRDAKGRQDIYGILDGMVQAISITPGPQSPTPLESWHTLGALGVLAVSSYSPI